MGPSHRPSASLPFPHACGAASASRKRDSVHDPVEAMAPGVPQGACDPGRLGPTTEAPSASQDRKSVVSGKSVSVRVDLGGGRIIEKKSIDSCNFARAAC